MKKKIIICIFLALIAITAICTIMGAIESYNYDMDPKNNIDIMQGIGAAIIIVLGGLTIFCELDLFYTVYYFFIKPKTITKSVLNILSSVSLLLIFFTGYIADALLISEEANVTIALFLIYLLLRSVYAFVSILSSNKEC